ncbi:XTP/dITP diphosphatase [archaeon]|nr:XTP/dITP diphosphatase [archaeon]
MKIAFATGNKNKVLELKKILEKTNIQIIQKNIEIEEPRSESLQEIAITKANYAVNKLKMSVIVEDSGLFIDSLNNFPGTYSHWVYDKIGYIGIINLINKIKTRKATFKAVIVYLEPNKKPQIFTGEKQGTIALESKGVDGFGYDPIFIPKNETKTWAENPNSKNQSSHRQMAIKKFTNWATTNL